MLGVWTYVAETWLPLAVVTAVGAYVAFHFLPVTLRAKDRAATTNTVEGPIYTAGMATNPVINVRLRPVIVAYLDELASIGGHGKGRSGVMRRFIENGIVRAIERHVIEKRSAANFGESADDEDDED